jgi:hypothetical protein
VENTKSQLLSGKPYSETRRLWAAKSKTRILAIMCAANSVNVGIDGLDFAPILVADIEVRARDLPINSSWKAAEGF